MAVSVNPGSILDLLAFLLRRKKDRKEKVVAYVESIANEATSLAGVWQSIFDKIAAGATVSPSEDPGVAKEIAKYVEPNQVHYARLLE